MIPQTVVGDASKSMLKMARDTVIAPAWGSCHGGGGGHVGGGGGTPGGGSGGNNQGNNGFGNGGGDGSNAGFQDITR